MASDPGWQSPTVGHQRTTWEGSEGGGAERGQGR